MSQTAGGLIASSLRLIGVLASGETAQASEASDALSSLNNLLDSWSTESLMIPNKVREVFPLTPGQQTYTMGAGGNFNTSRAQKIEQAEIQITSSNPVIEVPIRVLTKDQYAEILIKTLTSTYPLYLYNDGAFPLDNVTLYPVPSQANNLVLYSWKPLSQLANLTTAISLPPGYERALRFGLAVELAPEYGRAVPEVVLQVAIEAKAHLKRINSKPKFLQVDDALRSRPAAWNWYTGEST